ncbi:flagellar assembly protein H [Picosynechococcus sp. PCC 7003]|uniref:DUF4351 domain-containing protein n=1 Tax=Picosynechococcus sp. PCC 7003 TaxID=374981 RepID=UPI0008103531|nr:DUF4351 domain-containing protein [Picosynechococcus sp. PCC 7003]ANV83157.1 flagellar assembly protein H [Picosynechococcus sp. PCC 7003]
MTRSIDHDLLFKELLTTFFWDFLALFAPEILETAEQDSLIFLTQEVFNDLPGQTRRNVDIVAKLRFRGQETCFLVHIENQATSQAEFAERMFLYFARLYEKYRLPIYPIALFSYRSPQRLEPETFSVAFPAKQILSFSFQSIQLNRLPWRDFLRQPNPVAAALMAKMNFKSEERPKVKLECLRMIVTLRLDSARIHLLSGFVDTYLRLNMAEQQVFEQELHRIQPQEEAQVLQIVTSWMEEGLQQGRQEEACKIILRFIQQRFPDQVSGFKPQIQALNLAQLDALSDRLFGFESAAELETWLRENPTEANPT